ncbi:MAG: hypothetical protein ACREDT_00545 [Methylocella sp.]
MIGSLVPVGKVHQARPERRQFPRVHIDGGRNALSWWSAAINADKPSTLDQTLIQEWRLPDCYLAKIRLEMVTPRTAIIAAHGVFFFVHDNDVPNDDFRRKLLYVRRLAHKIVKAVGDFPRQILRNRLQ